jgi:hypothetical protein
MCKGGYTKVAWFILFLPFISFFILLALFILMSLGTMAEQTLTSSEDKDTIKEYNYPNTGNTGVM